ncbi:MAG: glutamate synthase [Rhodospirillaceae bacterium]|jgi:methylamine---glutamate N-methyltransferase subunit C|nr:glutamate synthase [Rhodospirillaceae bacterium]MBT5242789.1 glutamate synthase [Rhodospirillaceae bacterium]MBT5563990.1 glutamate synthase [Rhodospirillaceae bacterium]MBT6243265.1 glutamate synthase [Rhodospirillaceae bacterium]
MATIDLAATSVRQANEQIRNFGTQGEDVEVINPDARHHIGVGLVHNIKVKIRGSAGYFCAGLTDGCRVEIDNNVGWGLADNMLGGCAIVRGNASAIAAVAMRGGEVVVHGNIGSRAGQVMKEGTLLAAGNANFMAGYMMYGGRIIILGNSGEKLGQDMTGGDIYVGGKIDSLGTDAQQIDLPGEEEDSIREFLEHYQIPFKGGFQKVVNAGEKLRYDRTEPRVRNVPFFVASGKSDYWNEKVQEDIHVKSVIGRYRIRGYGTTRALPHLSDIAFKRDLSTIKADADVVRKVNLATEVGGRNGGKPISLSMPVMIAPMSYGALSKSTKLALAIASKKSGISENTGEGGMIDKQREVADQLIYQCLSGRLGWNIHDMQRADGLEIYISQGAKPGLGGQLMAKKVTKEIATIRGIPEGIDLRSPSRHPDVLGADDLVIKIEEFREATGYRVPVSVKLGAGRVRDDIKIAWKDGFDFVELDGLQGSTGAAGNEVLEYVGIPTLSAIQETMDSLDEVGGREDMPIVLMGGVKDGVDAAKAIALGAHAVAVGTAAIIAGGCIACLQCHVGQCVVGIATQDPEHEKRYDTDAEAEHIHKFLESVRWQIAAIADAHGYKEIHQLGRDDLVALTPEAAEITRLPYAPEYRQNDKNMRKDAL